VVVQAKYIMADCFSPEMDPDLHIQTSEKGFTTDEIAVKWLYHIIKHSDAGPDAEWKLLWWIIMEAMKQGSLWS
jgi:hypothetical protein